IALDHSGTDVIQIAGENLLQTPLELSASEFEVQSGILIIDSTVTGTGGLTKSGPGTLVVSGLAEWSGTTTVAAGSLQIDTTLQNSESLSVSAGGVLTGTGGTTGALQVSGVLAPLADADGFTASEVELSESATLSIKIGGSLPGDFAKLIVTDSALLDGTLAVEFASDFQPSPGDTFKVLSAGQISGTFRNWVGLDYGPGSLLPVMTPTGLLLIASDHVSDSVVVHLDNAADAAGLTGFFSESTPSATFTGSLHTLRHQLSGSFILTRELLDDGSATVVSIEVASAGLVVHGDTSSLITLSAGQGKLIMTQGGLWGQLDVSLSESLSDLQINGTFALQVNTSGSPAPGIFDLPGGPFLRVTAGEASLDTVGGIMTGPLIIEPATESGGPILRFASAGMRVLYGDNAGTPAAVDDWGAVIPAATLVGIVNADGTVALSAEGNVALLRTGDLQLSGIAAAQVNTTGSDWLQQTISVNGQSWTLNVLADSAGFGPAVDSALTASIDGFVTVTGSYSLHREQSDSDVRLTLSATDASSFLGFDEGLDTVMGLEFSAGTLGAIIQPAPSGGATYALIAAGDTVLRGSDTMEMSLEGTAQIRINRTGADVYETIQVDGEDFLLNFPIADNVTEFVVEGDLGFANFIEVDGTHWFSIQEDLLAAYSEGTVFLGSAGGTADARGLQILDATLLMAFSGDLYAVTAAGDAGLAGLPGMQASGSFDVLANKLGASIDVDIPTPRGVENLLFETDEELMDFTGSPVFTVPDVFELSGDVVVTKIDDDLIFVDNEAMTISISVAGREVFTLEGAARFGIGTSGFEMMDIGLETFAVFGINIAALGGAMPLFALPDPDAPPEPAELTTIIAGIDVGLINRSKYIDVTFASPSDNDLDPASILDEDPEFTLDGSAVLNVEIARVEQLTDDTFRYHLKKQDAGSDNPMFIEGKVELAFAAGTWTDTPEEGQAAAENKEHSLDFDVQVGEATAPVGFE
ncbi:MAG: hypothetical protein RL215_2086, partial [Planctomycetota bacterium]